ncbi:hypothetical protein ZYGR_0N00810 [Zygosaccharomyces rouxii]|uniref:ZYRO0D02310p n=2 Tax=Zygosaccharomyces rouxii TaxID=4956 RepID=C5DUY0_ZYGRC|nr:uncharacterized protein ZYRO0D02310g [Zygosaccharomyces rouxii]GAV48677.1 hypothetical protein ZYGR_0N00810 [Zygosaccharomyces rouxii]CAR27599.1 ZYRO0D02310p [Zygosaccharomyces rouxii]
MLHIITHLLLCTVATAWPIGRKQQLPQQTAPYARIQTLQGRIIDSDSSQLVKSLYEHVLTFNAAPSGTLHQSLDDLSQAIELNLATAAILNTTSSSVATLEYFTRLQIAAQEINSHSLFVKNRFSPSYWALEVPFQFTFKSTIAYRCWQLNNLQNHAIHNYNGSLLLQETFDKVRDITILLEASVYMLSQLKTLGFQQLYQTCQPILTNFFQPLLQKPLSQENLHSLQDQLNSLAENDLSRHRYSELALASFLVILLASSTISLIPLMCKQHSDRLMLTRCILYLVGMTWFHMMVFFLYFCKLRRDFEM